MSSIQKKKAKEIGSENIIKIHGSKSFLFINNTFYCTFVCTCAKIVKKNFKNIDRKGAFESFAQGTCTVLCINMKGVETAKCIVTII